MSTKKADATDQMRKGIDTVMYGRMKPHLNLTTEDLPAIKDWKVGQTYKLEVTVKQIGASIDTYGKENHHSATFEILNVSEEEKD